VNHLIFHPYKIAAEFIAAFEELAAKFQQPSAQKFLTKLWENHDKACGTFTAAHFTAGHVATQCVESNNSHIKEGGSLKKELSTFNLQQLGDYILCIARDQDHMPSIKIKKYIKAGAEWSNVVNEVWKSEHNKANNYQCTSSDESTWTVKHHDGKGSLHTVTLPSDFGKQFPTCDCRDFTSRLIPCHAICAVYDHIQHPLFSRMMLHPRWWLNNHPEYVEAMYELGLANKSIGINTEDKKLIAAKLNPNESHLELL
jgi:hypothetical protein